MSEAPKGRAYLLWGLLAVGGTAVVASGIYWKVYAGQPDLREELASGDAERMRSALLQADTEMLRGKEGRETRDLTIEAMRKMSMEELMALWRNDSLSEDERRRMMENMRAVWMTHMADMAEEYFAASEDEKVAILDKQIDQWQAFMERMREYREAHQDDPEYQQRREQERERWRQRQRSPEERKQQMADQDPDQQAKMFYLFGKMRQRAQERGMDMGWGMGRGRGGRSRGGDDQGGESDDRPPRERHRE
ncbi:MAG: hypothetical protein ACYSUI_20560 [Planctomycetota bacterium]